MPSSATTTPPMAPAACPPLLGVVAAAACSSWRRCNTMPRAPWLHPGACSWAGAQEPCTRASSEAANVSEDASPHCVALVASRTPWACCCLVALLCVFLCGPRHTVCAGLVLHRPPRPHRHHQHSTAASAGWRSRPMPGALSPARCFAQPNLSCPRDCIILPGPSPPAPLLLLSASTACL
jgi:hypothetical protein